MHYIGGINGNIAGPLVSIAFYLLLFMLLFRLPMSDQVTCVMLLWIMRAGVAYLIFRYEGYKNGSEF
jgi:hypothetical protein